jgi:hypothetical protein
MAEIDWRMILLSADKLLCDSVVTEVWRKLRGDDVTKHDTIKLSGVLDSFWVDRSYHFPSESNRDEAERVINSIRGMICVAQGRIRRKTAAAKKVVDMPEQQTPRIKARTKTFSMCKGIRTTISRFPGTTSKPADEIPAK